MWLINSTLINMKDKNPIGIMIRDEIEGKPLPTKCPKCGSEDVTHSHHQATFAIPECDYWRCDDCDYQWRHN